jgi:hypothetical protein
MNNGHTNITLIQEAHLNGSASKWRSLILAREMRPQIMEAINQPQSCQHGARFVIV